MQFIVYTICSIYSTVIHIWYIYCDNQRHRLNALTHFGDWAWHSAGVNAVKIPSWWGHGGFLAALAKKNDHRTYPDIYYIHIYALYIYKVYLLYGTLDFVNYFYRAYVPCGFWRNFFLARLGALSQLWIPIANTEYTDRIYAAHTSYRILALALS